MDDIQKITTFLMFDGRAEEAMTFYVSIFPRSRVVSLAHYDRGEPGAEGTVKHAIFELAEQQFMCSDSSVPQPFSFTPSISLFVSCSTEEEISDLYEALEPGGQVLMPLDAYEHSGKFAWIQDRFGVSWQLNLV